MIVVLLLWLGLTALTGWLSLELSGNIAEWLESIHETLGEFSFLLVTIHIAGVVVMSFLERQNLAISMIDGKKHIDLE
jgi:cytochrome b